MIEITTTTAVYFYEGSLSNLNRLIGASSLVPVVDDYDKKLYLNPAAIRTVRDGES